MQLQQQLLLWVQELVQKQDLLLLLLLRPWVHSHWLLLLLVLLLGVKLFGALLIALLRLPLLLPTLLLLVPGHVRQLPLALQAPDCCRPSSS
jgi:hypothetical protein